MREEISSSFLSKFSANGSEAVQVLSFSWNSRNQLVSDRKNAFGYQCYDLVVDWGKLDDAVDISKAVNGSGYPTRQMTVSLLNTSETGWFCSKFAEEHPENVKVGLYQLVEGESPVLIDLFYIQSPIEYTEGELTVSLTLVSQNQFVDPYVGTLDPVTNKFYGVVIGSMSGVPGTLYGSNPWAKLASDLAAGATTIQTDRNLSQAGFASSGTLIIDFDTISYSGISGSSFTGVSGVDSSHSSGQYLFVSTHEYLFAFGAGPVGVAGPVYVNGSAYADCTIYKDRNPVQVGFMGGFPFKRVDKKIQETKSYSLPLSGAVPGDNGKCYADESSGIRNFYGFVGGSWWTGEKFCQTISFGLNLPLGAEIISGYGSVSFYHDDESNIGDNYTEIKLLGKNYIYNSSTGGATVSRNSTSAADYNNGANSLIMYYTQKNSGSGYIRLGRFQAFYLQATYQYDEEGYPKKEHYENVSLQIGTLGVLC